MVGKKSGKALLREEGLERTDNNMELSSWPVVQPINQKNYYVDFLKRDEQLLAVRMSQEEARNKMIKQHKDRDRALAQGKQVGPDGDIDMDEDQEEEQDELATGSKTIVLHFGSQNLRIGLANDALPKTVPMVIARQAKQSESEENDGEPSPKRRKLDNGNIDPAPEKRWGEDFASKFVAMSNELKIRMRMNKRKVLPQSRDMVTSYNKRTVYDNITEHNDTMRIEWADVSHKPEYVVGRAALRIPDDSIPRYKLYRPIAQGWFNEKDYDSVRSLYDDIRLIIEESVREELKLDIKAGKDWAQYNCVIIIPDYYERTMVTGLLDLAISDLGFARVCFVQESLAASFGAGFTTCCVVDIGAQKTSICCVEDGVIIDNSRVNLKSGGLDITEAFVKMIIYNHFPYSDINLKRRYDFLLVEELKAKYSTVVEADISVQLYDFYLRAPGQDTRKYTFKIYDEVALAPMALYKPDIFENKGKLNGRRKLIDMSYDIYDGKPNDPTSSAQAEIMTQIAPADILNSTVKQSTIKVNGTAVAGNLNGISKEEGTNDSRRPSIARVQEMDATPQPSGANSPVRKNEGGSNTPQPEGITSSAIAAGNPTNLENGAGGANGTPMPDDLSASLMGMQQNNNPQASTVEEQEPLSIERHTYPGGVLPIYPLPNALIASITHASKNSPQKTRDFLGSILLIGGASKTPGMRQYLEETLQGMLPGYAKDILVNNPPRELDPEVVVWKGGAVFGRMSRTNDSWITPFLYERLGERILAHKLMWAW